MQEAITIDWPIINSPRKDPYATSFEGFVVLTAEQYVRVFFLFLWDSNSYVQAQLLN